MTDAVSARRHTYAERGLDMYETPECATRTLLAHVRLPDRVWEPACGRGAISRILEEDGHDVVSSDIADYGYEGAQVGVDFTLPGSEAVGAGAEAIVTNPPFKFANAFAARAIERAPMVCMLLRLAFLEGGERSADRAFALDGGHLQRVLVFSRRLPGMHRDGWEGKRANSGAAFAWFVWDRLHVGEPTVRRVDWRKHV